MTNRGTQTTKPHTPGHQPFANRDGKATPDKPAMSSRAQASAVAALDFGFDRDNNGGGRYFAMDDDDEDDGGNGTNL